ncbi:MAG TPA: hypothetical protein VFL87_01530 [Thermoleophilaceae bacterium]|nr:hypothetical protein [Thermoleophilaceae bacterium]
MTLPFAVSDVCLVAAQAATVAIPSARRIPLLEKFRSGWWALVPLASIVVVIFGIQAASQSANALTYLALVTVPPLAALALAALAHGARPKRALAVLPLFALAWADRHGLVGEACGIALAILACVTLGALLAQMAPLALLKLGIVLMSIGDTVLVISQQLQAPNSALNAAAPGLGLPQLQRALFGSAVMGFGDFFIAAVFGAVLAAEARRQRGPARLTLLIALLFDLLFFAVSLLPATVPVALALIVTELGRRRTVGVKKPARLSISGAEPRFRGVRRGLANDPDPT